MKLSKRQSQRFINRSNGVRTQDNPQRTERITINPSNKTVVRTDIATGAVLETLKSDLTGDALVLRDLLKRHVQDLAVDGRIAAARKEPPVLFLADETFSFASTDTGPVGTIAKSGTLADNVSNSVAPISFIVHGAAIVSSAAFNATLEGVFYHTVFNPTTSPFQVYLNTSTGQFRIVRQTQPVGTFTFNIQVTDAEGRIDIADFLGTYSG
jgi:hypothetical protein